MLRFIDYVRNDLNSKLRFYKKNGINLLNYN
jgi:hypothetical protein